MGIEDGKGRNALRYGNLVLFGDGDVVIHVTDVNVDDDEVLREELGVGALVHVDVEDLAITTPVAAEVEDDALMFGTGLLEGSDDVGGGIGSLGVEMLLDEGDGRLGMYDRPQDECKHGGCECNARD